MLEKLTRHHFQPYLNQTFHIHLDNGQQVDVQLTTLTELGAAPQTETARRPFSLIFCGPMERVLPQRIYPVEHANMGRLDLFLVPVGPDQEGMQYEALFA